MSDAITPLLYAASVALTRAREFHYYIKTDDALAALVAAEKAYDRAVAARAGR